MPAVWPLCVYAEKIQRDKLTLQWHCRYHIADANNKKSDTKKNKGQAGPGCIKWWRNPGSERHLCCRDCRKRRVSTCEVCLTEGGLCDCRGNMFSLPVCVRALLWKGCPATYHNRRMYINNEWRTLKEALHRPMGTEQLQGIRVFFSANPPLRLYWRVKAGTDQSVDFRPTCLCFL